MPSERIITADYGGPSEVPVSESALCALKKLRFCSGSERLNLRLLLAGSGRGALFFVSHLEGGSPDGRRVALLVPDPVERRLASTLLNDFGVDAETVGTFDELEAASPTDLYILDYHNTLTTESLSGVSVPSTLKVTTLVVQAPAAPTSVPSLFDRASVLAGVHKYDQRFPVYSVYRMGEGRKRLITIDRTLYMLDVPDGMQVDRLAPSF
jgi:hypothetical protein